MSQVAPFFPEIAAVRGFAVLSLGITLTACYSAAPRGGAPAAEPAMKSFNCLIESRNDSALLRRLRATALTAGDAEQSLRKAYPGSSVSCVPA